MRVLISLITIQITIYSKVISQLTQTVKVKTIQSVNVVDISKSNSSSKSIMDRQNDDMMVGFGTTNK